MKRCIDSRFPYLENSDSFHLRELHGLQTEVPFTIDRLRFA